MPNDGQPGTENLDIVQHPFLGELRFPKDMPNDERNASIEDLESQRMNVAPKQAGVINPSVAPLPLAGKMQSEGETYKRSLGPQTRIEQLGTPEEKARLASGLNMDIPIALMSIGAASPIGAISRGGISGYLKPLFTGALKSAAGSEIGRLAGRSLGGIWGDEGAKTGSQIGGIVGGLGGPFISGETFAKLPFGLGRFIATDDEVAAARAAMKVKQRTADIEAGLRQHPGVLAHAEMEEALAPKPTADEIAERKLTQAVANESAKIRAGLAPSQEEQIRAELEKEFLSGRSAGRVPPVSIPVRPSGAPAAIAPNGRNPLANGAIGMASRVAAPEEPSVLLAPIKTGPFPNNPAGNIQNVPRELLPGIVSRTGDPAAVREFSRTTNTPALYVGEHYPGPREIIPVGEERSSFQRTILAFAGPKGMAFESAFRKAFQRLKRATMPLENWPSNKLDRKRCDR